MATPQAKKKISDFFNAFSNPAGSIPMSTAPSSAYRSAAPMSMIPTNKKTTEGARQALASLYNGGSAPSNSYRLKPEPLPLPTEAPMSRPISSAAVPTRPVAPGTGGPATPAPAGTGGDPAVALNTPVNVPPQWMKPDGTFKTPEEIANDVAGSLKSSSEQGDVGKMAAAEIMGGEKTAEQLRAEAGNLSAIRNDIASGETDPYKVGAESGIAWSPEQLSAIEKAQAGIYDPAINTVFARLEAKQNEEAKASEWQSKLDELAVKHGYDMEAMEKDQEFQKAMIGYKASLDAATAASGLTPYSDERSQRTIQSIDELMGQVNGWTTGWGTLLKNIPTTDAKNFDSQLNTLKAAIAFGELTAMREASKTGGALGNVSNIELNLLESALAGLDSAQSPEDFKVQLNKAKGSINRWRAAQGAAPLGGPTPTSSKVLVSATGESFDASALSPEEYQEAINDGYKPQ